MRRRTKIGKKQRTNWMCFWATTCGKLIAFMLCSGKGAEESYRRQNPTSKYYDYRLIHERLQSLILAREEGDILQLVNLLRSGLVRNLGNISTPRLFNRAFAGTKLLIEDYITQVAQAIADVTKMPTSPGGDGNGAIPGFSSQAKLDLLHDTRQAFGRSTLVLQGGAIFGLCHLGVVKSLFARGLLPRIITGTATGALIAALVGVHTEDELPSFLNGDSIDLSAFAGKSYTKDNGQEKPGSVIGWWSTLKRRVRRFLREGYFLDVTVLEECVRSNVGDLTFEEAYNRTKRVLNITVATTGRGGVPNLLNYLTAPNVVSIVATLILENLAKHHIAHLVSGSRLQRLIANHVWPLNNTQMQRLIGSHHTVVCCDRHNIPTMDSRVLHGSRLTTISYRRTLQRQSFHSQSSPTIPRAIPPKRHARPLTPLHSRWTNIYDRRPSPSDHHGDSPSTPAARQSRPSPPLNQAFPSRRTYPRCISHTRPRVISEGLRPFAGDAYAG